MIKIKRLRSLTKCGIFEEFSWPPELPPFQDFNLVYGWNGTGKTTLAEVLRLVERGNPPKKAAFDLECEGARVKSESLSAKDDYPIRVFTRSYVETAVFRASGELDPIYFLGEESVERKKELDHLQKVLDSAAERAADCKKRERAASRVYEDYCQAEGARVKQKLRRRGKKGPFDNYNKAMFKAACADLADDARGFRLSEDEYASKEDQLKEEPRDVLRMLPLASDSLVDLEQGASELLAKTVAAAALKELRDDHERRRWLQQGLVLHQQRKSKTCLFCGLDVPLGRLDDLDRHFDDQAKKLEAEAEGLLGRISKLAGFAPALPERADFYKSLRSEYVQARSALEEEIAALKERCSTLKESVEAKKHRPFESQQLSHSSKKIEVVEATTAVNELVRRNNQMTDGLREAVQATREALHRHLVATAFDKWQELKLEAETTCRDSKEAKAEQSKAQRDLEGLKRKQARHGPPADQLNTDLRAYLGRDEIRFELAGDGYRILRHGELAKRLSEGERTAIALLYFLKSLKDQRFNLANGIVVLDDPVSSLDQNALFNAVAFIQECTREAGQLFVLTHNFSFFRQVRNWFDHVEKRRGKIGKTVGFYSLRSVWSGKRRASMICPLDDTLRTFHSEYHFLFATVFRASSNAGDGGSFDHYHLPNIARRLLEGFLSFRYPRKGSFHRRLLSSTYDPEKLNRIYRFVNTHSHSESFDSSMDQDMSILAEAQAVLLDVLDLIRHESSDHYEEMKVLVTAS